MRRRRIPTLPVVLVAAEQLAVLDARRELEDFAASAARMYGLHVGSIGVRGADVDPASPILTPPAS